MAQALPCPGCRRPVPGWPARPRGFAGTRPLPLRARMASGMQPRHGPRAVLGLSAILLVPGAEWPLTAGAWGQLPRQGNAAELLRRAPPPRPPGADGSRGGARAGAALTQPIARTDVAEDPDCAQPWKGHAFQWQTILGNTERLLNAWAGRGGDLSAYLSAFAEELAGALAIDHGWSVFKIVARAECPLGGVAVASVLRWRCAGGDWEADLASPSTRELFLAMRRQLPILRLQPAAGAHSGRQNPREAEAHVRRPTPGWGCEGLLGRYLETALHRLDLPAALRSRWPVFELLSAHHAASRAWPQGYP
uniref:Uncharacterized protein n=1 Tax=Alexandrium monilatum TaxID=311494 RepID=A0A7S4Q9S5_9DINO